jgi:hypothetical protein
MPIYILQQVCYLCHPPSRPAPGIPIMPPKGIRPGCKNLKTTAVPRRVRSHRIASSAIHSLSGSLLALTSSPLTSYISITGPTLALEVSAAQHVQWRVNQGGFPTNPGRVIMICGSNNIRHCHDKEAQLIANTIITTACLIKNKYPSCKLCVVGILPRQDHDKCRAANRINSIIEYRLPGNISYVAPPSVLYSHDGLPRAKFYEWDNIHINEKGYRALYESINLRMSLDDIAAPSDRHPRRSIQDDCGLFETEFLGSGWDGDGEAKHPRAHVNPLSVKSLTPDPFPPLPCPSPNPPNPAPFPVFTHQIHKGPPPVARTIPAVDRQVTPAPLHATKIKSTCRPFIPFCCPPRGYSVTHSLSEQFRRKRPKPTPPRPL